MRMDEYDIEDFDREIRESRLATAASLQRAASMLPPDPLCTTAVANLAQSALEGDQRRASEQTMLALDHLERHAGDAAMPREFWIILQDAAVREAEYERARRYKARAGAE